METILEKIIRSRRLDIERDKKEITPAAMEKKARELPPLKNNFLDALSIPPVHGIHVIAEVKKASPSKGIITEDFDHLTVAKNYAEGGASALSVLTEEKFFLGSNQFLVDISKQVPLPTLRKDFIIDPYQVFQARCLGASSFLLIVDCLKPQQIAELIQLGDELGLTALVEVHRSEEIKIALEVGARLMGVNNRNLRTFETTLDVSLELRGHIPEHIITVSESGIESTNELRLLTKHGYQAVLIGEKLMREPKKIEENLRNLLGGHS